MQSSPLDSRFKAIIFLTRQPDTTRDAFRDWWLTEHRTLAERLPRLRRHTFNLLPEDSPYDAVVEQWFDSAEALEAAYRTEAGRAVARDSTAHVAFRQRVTVTEHVFDIDPEQS
ncbi:MAG: EthD family reductase [Pseudomonadales bacterium]